MEKKKKTNSRSANIGTMGDGASDALQRCSDYDDLMSDYLSGVIDDTEAYERGLIDEYGGLHQDIVTKKCRCCGEDGLVWGEHEGKWRLFKEGKLHKCPVNPLRDIGK